MSAARTGDILTYVALVALGVFFAVPFAWLISLALRTPAEVYLGAARFIPSEPTLGNFATILSDPAFLIYLWNGLKPSALGAGWRSRWRSRRPMRAPASTFADAVR